MKPIKYEQLNQHTIMIYVLYIYIYIYSYMCMNFKNITSCVS